MLLIVVVVTTTTTTVHAEKTKGVRRRRHLKDSTTGTSHDDDDSDDNNNNNNVFGIDASTSADDSHGNDRSSFARDGRVGNDSSVASGSIDESDNSSDDGGSSGDDTEKEESSSSSSSDSKKHKIKVKQRSPPPLDDNGKRVPKDYQFKAKPDGLQIQTRYRDDVIESLEKKKGKKGKRYTETMDWNIRSNEEGFSVETRYENRNELTNVQTSIQSLTFKIVEFVKNDADDIHEVYIDQPIVTEYFFNEWQPPQLDGECTATTTCRAIFSTVDECFTVIATANIHTAIANGRFQMDPDDVKFDYVFGDSCSLSSDNHGLSVVGKVRTDTKTNVKSHNKGLLPMAMDTDMEGMEEPQVVASELDGVASEEDDGVSLFLTWINELDCTEVTMDDDESLSSGVGDFIPIDVNSALMSDNLDQDGANVSSIIAQQITNQTRVVPRGANASDVGRSSEGIIHTTQRTLPINVHTYDVDTSTTTEDGDSSSSSSSTSSEKYIHWTLGTSRKDRGCVWDPVVGVQVTEEVTMSSAASTSSLISALSATAIVVLVFVGFF